MDSRGNEGQGFDERSTREETRSQISEMQQRAQQKVGDVATQTREEAEAQATRQKQRASGQLGSIGSALRETSQSLRRQEQEAVAGYVENAASQVDRLSHYLGDRTVRELVDEAQDFARREPALFLGGAFLLGLVGARFMRSSARHHDGRETRFERFDRDEPSYRSERWESDFRRTERPDWY